MAGFDKNVVIHTNGSLNPPFSMAPELQLETGYTDALGRVYNSSSYNCGFNTDVVIPVGSKVRARFGHISYPSFDRNGSVSTVACAQSYDVEPVVVLIAHRKVEGVDFALVGWMNGDVDQFGWFTTAAVAMSMLECVIIGDGEPVQFHTHDSAIMASRVQYRDNMLAGVYGVDGFVNNVTYQTAVTASCNPTIRDTIAKLRRADGKYNSDKVRGVILSVVSAEFSKLAISHYLKQQFAHDVIITVDLYQGNKKNFTFANDIIDWQAVTDFIMDEHVVFTDAPMDIKSVLNRYLSLWD